MLTGPSSFGGRRRSPAVLQPPGSPAAPTSPTPATWGRFLWLGGSLRWAWRRVRRVVRRGPSPGGRGRRGGRPGAAVLLARLVQCLPAGGPPRHSPEGGSAHTITAVARSGAPIRCPDAVPRSGGPDRLPSRSREGVGRGAGDREDQGRPGARRRAGWQQHPGRHLHRHTRGGRGEEREREPAERQRPRVLAA